MKSKIPHLHLTLSVGTLLISILTGIWWTGVSAHARQADPATYMGKSVTATSPNFLVGVTAIARRSNALLYDPQTEKIYASIPSGTDSTGNSIVRFNPTNGNIEQSVWVGSEPNKLALSSDGALYVSLDGTRTIRKVNLSSGFLGQPFQAGITSSDGPMRVFEISASPSNPNVVAVSRGSVPSTSIYGVAIFENGVRRQNVGPTSRAIAFSNSESSLLGIDYYSASFQNMTVNSTGITSVNSAPAVESWQIKFASGRLYTAKGHIYDAQTGNLIGTLATSDSIVTDKPFVIDSPNNRAFYAYYSGTGLTIRAFDTNTFVLLGIITVPNVYEDPRDIVRWGTNGLALSTVDGPTYFIQSDIVGPGTIPTQTASPTPTPSPNPPTFLRRVDIPNNDLVYNRSDGKIYTSIPSVGGVSLGNTITRVDPVSGEIVGSVFIGSEPNKLALSNDGTTLYASLIGANTIRRYDTTSQTPGLQFVPANNGYRTTDIAVLPTDPGTVAVSAGYGGLGIYDHGIRRPNPINASSVTGIEHNESGETIYGYNSLSSSFDLRRFAVDPNGLTVMSNIGNLVSGYYSDFVYVSGRLYVNDGRVVDPESNQILGQFDMSGLHLSNGSSVAVDLKLGRVFIVTDREIGVFDINTFNKIGSIIYPYDGDTVASPSSLVRWGSNGLAFRVRTIRGDNYINIIRSSLVSDPEPIPTVSVGGRVTTLGGNGVRNAIVSLTDSLGITRTAITGSFGYYRFLNVAPGPANTIAVISKRYRFSPRTVQIFSDTTVLDLVGQE